MWSNSWNKRPTHSTHHSMVYTVQKHTTFIETRDRIHFQAPFHHLVENRKRKTHISNTYTASLVIFPYLNTLSPVVWWYRTPYSIVKQKSSIAFRFIVESDVFCCLQVQKRSSPFKIEETDGEIKKKARLNDSLCHRLRTNYYHFIEQFCNREGSWHSYSNGNCFLSIQFYKRTTDDDDTNTFVSFLYSLTSSTEFSFTRHTKLLLPPWSF